MIPDCVDPRTGKPKIILQLCADTGSDTKPYKDAYYDVRLVGAKIRAGFSGRKYIKRGAME